MVAPETDLTLPAGTTTRPKWWRHLHSYLFMAQVAANVMFFLGMWWSAFHFNLDEGETCIMGISLGHVFLLGMWMALGGLHIAARLGIVACIIVLGSCVFAFAPLPFDLAILGVTIALVIHAALLPLRGLLKWRVNFDPAYHTESVGRAMQLKIRDILVWMVMWAIPFAFVRLIPMQVGIDFSFVAVVTAAVTSIVAAPCALAIVNCRRPWTWRLVAGLWIVLVLGVEGCLVAILIGGRGNPWWLVVSANGGVLAPIVGNLLIMRLYGLHLFRLQPTADGVPSISTPQAAIAIKSRWGVA